MAETLKVTERKEVGKRNSQKLRDSGFLPAVLYGHGEPSVSLTIPMDQFNAAMRHHARIVALEGAADGQALLQALQWDAFGREVLHVDLLRVRAGERLTVEVPVALKGEAPGESEGGIVELMLHSIEIEAPPSKIPDTLHVNVAELHLNGSLHVGDIFDLPEGADFITDKDEVLVHCVPPAAEPESEEIVSESEEPEIIARKQDEEEGGDE